MSLRQEFVQLAGRRGHVRALCRRFGISPRPATSGGRVGARRRRPRPAGPQPPPALRARRSPGRRAGRAGTAPSHPAWGARKIARRVRAGQPAGPQHRHAHPAPPRPDQPGRQPGRTALQRFEHEAPNALWQIDFKGHFADAGRRRCHPLTVLDDHSRFNLVLQAWADQPPPRRFSRCCTGVRALRPAGAHQCRQRPALGQSMERSVGLTALAVWLIRLGVPSATAAPITRRPTARTSASIARWTWRCWPGGTSPTWPTCSATLTPGA